jgi:hypothetical protein
VTCVTVADGSGKDFKNKLQHTCADGGRFDPSMN